MRRLLLDDVVGHQKDSVLMALKQSGPCVEKFSIASEWWSARIRVCFWILGVLLGGIITYTTRHFINGDAIAYLDMAQAFVPACGRILCFSAIPWIFLSIVYF